MRNKNFYMCAPLKTFAAIAACAVFVFINSCAPAATTGRPQKKIATVPAIPESEEPAWILDDTPKPLDTGFVFSDDDLRFGGGILSPDFEELPEDYDPSRIATAEDAEKILTPAIGGRAIIYIYRNFMDDLAAEFVRLNPFASEEGEGIFNIVPTHRRLELTLTKRVVRANGRRVTSLDFIELWTRFIKSRPAQGLALFHNLQGIEEFINGKEPLISGFNAVDENTILIRLQPPDPLAFQRLNTSKLLGGPFQLGAYYTAGVSDNEIKLMPNANSPRDSAFLAELIIQTGGDESPLTSFAAGRYSIVMLYKTADLEIARRLALEESPAPVLLQLPSDRYFLAVRNENADVRRFIRGIVNGGDILQNVIMGEGEEIESVISTSQTRSLNISRGRVNAPQIEQPLRIVYREDDPMSKLIAEKLFTDKQSANVPAQLAGVNAEGYEVALMRKTYDCIVGWVPSTINENVTEQLHFMSTWFANPAQADALVRLREHWEIPLFSVDNYVLMQSNILLHNNKITSIRQR